MSGTTATDLWRLSATELAAAIRSRQATSQEVVAGRLRRIAAVNPAVNAVVAKQAREAARAADAAVDAGGDFPPLHETVTGTTQPAPLDHPTLPTETRGRGEPYGKNKPLAPAMPSRTRQASATGSVELPLVVVVSACGVRGTPPTGSAGSSSSQ